VFECLYLSQRRVRKSLKWQQMLLCWPQNSVILFHQKELLQLEDFLRDTEPEYGDVTFYMEIRFLKCVRKPKLMSGLVSDLWLSNK
jgi:hypothetical protein